MGGKEEKNNEILNILSSRVTLALLLCSICLTRNKQGLLPIDYATTEEMLSILSTSTPNKDNESSTMATSLLNGKVSKLLISKTYQFITKNY